MIQKGIFKKQCILMFFVCLFNINKCLLNTSVTILPFYKSSRLARVFVTVISLNIEIIYLFIFCII